MDIHSIHSMEVAGAVIDGVPVVGLWDGDNPIEFAPSSDEGAHLIGADGSSVWSQFSDKSSTFTVRVQPASPTHLQLTQKANRQESGIPRSFSVTFFNLGGAEVGVATNCFIQKRPSVQLGKNATAREWVISGALSKVG